MKEIKFFGAVFATGFIDFHLNKLLLHIGRNVIAIDSTDDYYDWYLDYYAK